MAGGYVGTARSIIAYPLVVAGPWYSPVVFDEPGTGHRIRGELYRVDDATLDALDRIEGVDREGGYHRIRITVETDGGGEHFDAWCYVKNRIDVAPIHGEPMADYTDTRYVPRGRRPGND